MKKNIVFLGGGHSNTLAIRSIMQKLVRANLFEEVSKKYDFHLISEYNNSAYSGMIPGSICGLYSKSDSFVDLAKFSEIHNCNFICKKVKSIIPDKKSEKSSLIFADGEEFTSDLLCINVGSRTNNSRNVKGVDEYAIQTRPISELLSKIETKEKEFTNWDDNKTIIIGIVGGGVAGIELGFSLRHRLQNIMGKKSKIIIFSNEERVIPDLERNVVQELLDLAEKRDITFIYNSECVEIGKDKIVFIDKKENHENGLSKEMEFDLIIWATGAGPQKLNFQSNLDLDKRGFILVKDTLQCLNYKNIFAAGDCVQLESYKDIIGGPFPRKSGVYAVREGAILAENILKILTEENSNETELINYTPQTSFLKLITMGEKVAFGTKFGIPFYGKWVWSLKEFIDVNFVQMFYKDLEYDNTLTFDKIHTSDNFSYTVDLCIEKLTKCQEDEDFTIQLKIIDKLNTDSELLQGIKEKLNIY